MIHHPAWSQALADAAERRHQRRLAAYLERFGDPHKLEAERRPGPEQAHRRK